MVNGLLQNPNVSGNWLAKKLKSKDSIIAAKAAAHKNLPIKEFDNIKKLTNKTIIKALLSNPSCPKKYLNEYFYNEEDDTFDHYIEHDISLQDIPREWFDPKAMEEIVYLHILHKIIYWVHNTEELKTKNDDRKFHDWSL